jgi:thiol-disulfide isomerase/thioredoxin
MGLRVGDTAFPLEGADVNGNPIALSDFRGKVVVVDFWATWCKPCVEMIPHEKKMVERMKGRPFVLLGVSVDADREVFQEFLNRRDIRWPNILDGHNGPNAAKWEIYRFPTIHVIDAKGVIRHRDIAGPDLEQAVDKLVAEAEQGK